MTTARVMAVPQTASVLRPRRAFAPWSQPGAEPLITFEGVSKRFGSVEAVKSVHLAIYPREFFALLGGSGSGKTTLLRMLAGFETLSAGRIMLDKTDISKIPPHKRPINMMFQSYALFPHMSVADNIAYGLKQERLPKADIRERVAEMLALVKMPDFGHRKPSQLSGGQRQRVALARALAKRPKVLLLDEPLGALDRKLRESTQFELSNLQEQLGMTFIVVTHDRDEALTMADRVAIMRDGMIEQIGEPEIIYEAPRTAFVAEFLGDANIFSGRVEAGDVFVTGERRFALPTSPIEQKKNSWAMMVRPEKTRLTLAQNALEPSNGVIGTVVDIVYTGDLSVYHIRLNDGAIVRSSQTNKHRATQERITWDDTVQMTWSTEDVVLVQA